jgi:multidrug resistance efflux pump
MKGTILLGILLLIASIVTAIWVYDQRVIAAKNEMPNDPAFERPQAVFTWGSFDVEPGVAKMYPRQTGDIVSLVAEHTAVKEGEVLLQLDDKLARLKVDEALADLHAGQQQLAEAKLLTRQYELQRIQQEAAIKALDHEVIKIQRERDSKRSSLDPMQPLWKTVTELYAESLAELAEKKIAEQAKLKQLELLNAKLKIEQAEAGVQARQSRVDQAKEALKFYRIVAPSKGTVLRVYVHKGESLGPAPKVQAIDFEPDAPIIVRAEVLQEWGRFVKPGQSVEIFDDTYEGPKWTGKVRTLSKWYAPTRSPVIEPFRYNDVRTLECLIEVMDGGSEKFIGQRVRAKIKI